MAASDRRAPRDPHRHALARPRTASVLAWTPPRRLARNRDLDCLLGRLRVLHSDLRQLQQDLGISVGGDRHVGLAVADRARPPVWRRTERGDGAAPAPRLMSPASATAGAAVPHPIRTK